MIEARALYRDRLQHEVYRPRPEREAKPKKKKARYILTVGLMAITAMTSLVQSALLTEGQFRLEKLASELKSISAQNERLGVEVANLKSVARIEDIAKVKLNMTEPESHQIVYINEN